MNDVILETIRARMTRVFPAQIRAAVEKLSDEQLWLRPNEGSNSIGNLLLHLTGSLEYYLNRNLGGLDYTRDRDAEFAERRPLPKAEVMRRFDEMVAHAERTFDRLTPEKLGDPSPEPSMHSFVAEDLINALTHLATHAGQIVWIAKSLDAGAVHEVWIKSHRKEGAWKPRA
jgi:uncharacterized damage-inducible protein DinB